MKLVFSQYPVYSLESVSSEDVIVCDSKDMRAKRQVVEGVISQIKLFNAGRGWRTLTCVLVYTYAYAIGYSYYRRGELEA